MAVKKVVDVKQNAEESKPDVKKPAYTPDNPIKLEDKSVTKKKAVAKKPEEKKSAIKPNVKKPTENVKATKKVLRDGEYQFTTELILKRKFTDEDMCKQIISKFTERTEKQIMKAISACRYFMNAGKRKCFTPAKDGSNKIEQLVEFNNKVIPISQKPKIVKQSKRKVDPENDPLGKYAGIGPNAKKDKRLFLSKNRL